MNNTVSAGSDVAASKAMEIFAQQWQLYSKILDHDYLFNAGAYAALRRFLDEEVARPFRFLDLACGDASGIARALKGTQIGGYRGIDLAEPALNLARENLKTLACEVQLEEADFTEALRSRAEPVDIVWISLSLHHLDTPAKRTLMGEIRRAMGPNGAFLIYEPARDDGEGRAAYMDRFEDTARKDWTSLTGEEFKEAIDHVRTCDLPETVSDWKKLGEGAGFSRVGELYRSPDDLFRLIKYRP